MTELDVINFALSMAGEAPLNDADEMHPMVPTIKRYLEDEKVKLLLQKRWWFCSEVVTLSPDAVQGVIYIPQYAITCHPRKKYAYEENIVERGRRLYNTDKNTYLMDRSYECDVVYNLPFDEIPFLVQQVLQLATAMTFQMNFDADSQRLGQIQQQYQMYLAMLVAEDVRHKKQNFLKMPSTAKDLVNINGATWRGSYY